MRGLTKYIYVLSGILVLICQSCIHEYPVSEGTSPDKGKNPENVDAYIEVEYSVSWQSLLHEVDFNMSTKAREEGTHRFVAEVRKNGDKICHDEFYLTDNEFAGGKVTKKLSCKLGREVYEIAVWYDEVDTDGEYLFKVDNLDNVTIENFNTTGWEARRSMYSSDLLDLRTIDNKENASIIKPLEMQIAGGGFEIVATDVNQFITDHKTALNQGDSYTVHLVFTSGTSSIMDLFTGRLKYTSENVVMSGRMRLPFAEYDELKIAEGFLFCDEESIVTARLSVKNSALVTVSQTEYFSFPLKRGYITTVSGDFLTNPIDGFFKIDNIWEGEILIEI